MSIWTKLSLLKEKRWFRWLSEVIVFLLIFWGVTAYQTRHHVPSGEKAPFMELTTLSGERVTLEALHGKRVAIVFWAPWCQVCSAQSDNVSRVENWMKGRSHVISVAVGYQSMQQVQAYAAKNEVKYPVWLGSDHTLETWRLKQFPTVYFIDETGRLDGSVVGYTTTLGLLARLF